MFKKKIFLLLLVFCLFPVVVNAEDSSAELHVECEDAKEYYDNETTFKCYLKGDFTNIKNGGFNFYASNLEVINYVKGTSFDNISFDENEGSISFSKTSGITNNDITILEFKFKLNSTEANILLDEIGILDIDNHYVECEDVDYKIYAIPELANLNINGYTNSSTSYSYTLSPSFNKRTTTYSINLKEDASELKIMPSASNEEYTFVDGYGSRDLTIDDTTSSFQIKLKNGTQTNTYTINLVKPSSTNVSQTTTTGNNSTSSSSSSTDSKKTVENPSTGILLDITFALLIALFISLVYIIHKKRKIYKL